MYRLYSVDGCVIVHCLTICTLKKKRITNCYRWVVAIRCTSFVYLAFFSFSFEYICRYFTHQILSAVKIL